MNRSTVRVIQRHRLSAMLDALGIDRTGIFEIHADLKTLTVHRRAHRVFPDVANPTDTLVEVYSLAGEWPERPA